MLMRLKRAYQSARDRLKRIGPIHIIWDMCKTIRNGKKTYNNIIAKYGEDIQIYVEHYPGTGDVFITCALLKAYHFKKYGDKPYVVTAIGKGAQKIEELLCAENIEVLTQKDSDDMISYFRFMGDLPNFTILHFGPIAMHTRILDTMAGFNGLDFMSMYLNTVFKNMTWDEANDFPRVGETLIDEYLDEFCLEHGKTVVLFPYANTIGDLPIELWEELARHLREIGFSVCTNVEPGGPPIPGTYGVFVPYKHIKMFVERAGYVISLRSGMCDIIANTKCRKYILYPTPNFYKFGVGSFFDYFSLIHMKIGVNVREYEFERIYARNMFKYVFWDICAEVGISKKDYSSIYSVHDYSHHVLKLEHNIEKEAENDGI